MTVNKAIVNSGIRKLIGELDKRSCVPGEFVTVFKAYELRSDMFLVPTQQGPITITQNNVVPLDVEEGPVDIYAIIDNIRWFDEMDDRGLRYDNMVAQFEEIMMQNRAQRAGLTMARNVPREPPPGKILL